MKNFYAIVLFLSISFLGYAQLDTSFQRTTVEYNQLENQQLVDAQKHHLKSLADEKHSFKIGFEATSLPINKEIIFELPIANGLFANYEYRIKTGFSFNARLTLSLIHI